MRELREHQKDMLQFITDNKRCLAIACCGAGKTLTVLRAFNSNVLIVAPLRVARISWKDECDIEGIKYNFLSGKNTKFIDNGVNVTNFENVHNLVGKVPKYINTLVIDESSKLKNFQLRLGTKRAKILYGLSLGMKRVVLMTGTPASNSIGDLYSQITFLDGGATFGRSKYKFMQNFCYDMSKDKKFPIWVEREGSRETVLNMCKKYTKTFIPSMDMPSSVKIVNKYNSDLKRVLKDFKKDKVLKDDTGVVYACNNAVLRTRLLHLASGFMYDTKKNTKWYESKRIETLCELLEEVDEPCVIVVLWTASKDKISECANSVTCDIDLWRKGHYKHLVINPMSAGHGLSLQHNSRRMILYEPFYSVEQYEQVLERLSPIRQAQSGYNRTVYYHYITSDLGVDNVVWEALEHKKDVEKALIEFFNK